MSDFQTKCEDFATRYGSKTIEQYGLGYYCGWFNAHNLDIYSDLGTIVVTEYGRNYPILIELKNGKAETTYSGKLYFSVREKERLAGPCVE